MIIGKIGKHSRHGDFSLLLSLARLLEEYKLPARERRWREKWICAAGAIPHGGENKGGCGALAGPIAAASRLDSSAGAVKRKSGAILRLVARAQLLADHLCALSLSLSLSSSTIPSLRHPYTLDISALSACVDFFGLIHPPSYRPTLQHFVWLWFAGNSVEYTHTYIDMTGAIRRNQQRAPFFFFFSFSSCLLRICIRLCHTLR